MNSLFKLIRREPVVLVQAVTLALGVAVAFGLHLTDKQDAAIVGLVAFLGAIFARGKVTPVVEAEPPKQGPYRVAPPPANDAAPPTPKTAARVAMTCAAGLALCCSAALLEAACTPAEQQEAAKIIDGAEAFCALVLDVADPSREPLCVQGQELADAGLKYVETRTTPDATPALAVDSSCYSKLAANPKVKARHKKVASADAGTP
jgi:hypothetical protein